VEWVNLERARAPKHTSGWRSALHAGRYGAVRPKYLFAAPKFGEDTSAPERIRTSPTVISLTHIPASQHPRRVRKADNEQHRTAPETLEHAIFPI